MKREHALAALENQSQAFDILVVGGGATGAGIALDAASRGYSVALLERDDFGSGTSSKSTKLIHGGVRYLANGHIGLVREALAERSLLLKNAGALVKSQAFVIPFTHWFERLKYSIGLFAYDRLAGSLSTQRSGQLSRRQVAEALPTLALEDVRGGIRYYDAQFDDTRLLWVIIERAAANGAIVANYCEVVGLKKHRGQITGVEARDSESDHLVSIDAHCVINATGIYSDEVVALDEQSERQLAPSQGSHIVLDRAFHPSDQALLIPKTADGRVMFVLPWLNHTIVGTTDIPVTVSRGDPVPTTQEIDLILSTLAAYSERPPQRSDILSCFAGIRPLSVPSGEVKTSKISREHRIDTSSSGLISITGGKWTTYRKMAEQCVDVAESALDLSHRRCVSDTIELASLSEKYSRFSHYGFHAGELQRLVNEQPDLGEPLCAKLPYCKAEVLWAVRSEMARTLADVLARRTRALFLNARAAIEIGPLVVAIMQQELQRDDLWAREEVKRFELFAKYYVVE